MFRLGAIADGGRETDVRRGDAEVGDGGADAHEQLAIVGIDGREPARVVGVDVDRVGHDAKHPRLRIAARRRQHGETQKKLHVIPEYLRKDYLSILNKHMEEIKKGLQGSQIDYTLMNTSKPLDAGLFSYLAARANSV